MNKKSLPLLLSLAIMSMLPLTANAQGFDTGSLANQSLGASGSMGNTTARSGEGIADRALSGNSTSVTGLQLGSMTTGLGHLMLPQAGFGGLAPVFGYGAQSQSPPTFTTAANDPITLGLGSGNSITINPSTGATYARTGTTRTGVTFDGNGNPTVTVKTLNGYGGTSGPGGITPSLGGIGGLLGGGGSSNAGSGF
jgi:hypothetical protein